MTRGTTSDLKMQHLGTSHLLSAGGPVIFRGGVGIVLVMYWGGV